ncbi:Fic family protein [Dyadobacter sediminis]|uniref:Fic family protein n=1 Tax=Dyadobacter sediminis TaxID=1493691 RepID=A0A5R9KDJ3_9BACT|nr:Fic family protein [Dyadobacter sediminis]TLU94202.1 Fic family protein [Dyadobacter sediminis]
MAQYIHQKAEWPAFAWQDAELSEILGKVKYAQGKLAGRMDALGFSVRSEAMLNTLMEDVLKSTEIEGEILNPEQVRSSIARRLGLEVAGLVPSDRNVDGMVEMTLDATQHYNSLLTKDRLCGWQSSLFPSGRSGMYTITTGNWRNNEKGPMQVVSGQLGNETVHFEAPDADRIEKEMDTFLHWFNHHNDTDPIIKSGIAHLWFVTIHPFDDGNGRIARTIADMQLARSDNSTQRFYSMSLQIRLKRNAYYNVLEKTQKGSLDITDWLQWFLACLYDSLTFTGETLNNVLKRTEFWDKHSGTPLNDRQRLMINKIQETFFGKLTSSKWAKITKSSQDTAGRDIQDLIAKGILRKEASGGRSTSYELVW